MLTIKYFTSSWCQPCKAFGPTVDRVVFETNVYVQKIDVDSNPDLVTKYGVTSIPTLIFEKENNVIRRFTGVMSYSELLNQVTSLG
jgi:thioredoxin 1